MAGLLNRVVNGYRRTGADVLNHDSEAELKRTLMAKAEQQITQTAQQAAAPHGGVKIRFDRKPDGTLRSVEFQGSEAAIEAARAAVAS